MCAPEVVGETLPSPNRSVLFAVGERGTPLFFPTGVTLAPVASPIVERAPLSDEQQRALIDQALATAVDGKTLKEIAAGKRRVAILTGDLSRPARYDIALPAIVEALVAADIRPSRMAFFACPGGNGALLGRSAIHRYGEEICGDHEVNAWPADGVPGALFDTADLCIAVAPHRDGVEFFDFLPKNTTPDFALELTLSRSLRIEVEAARPVSSSRVKMKSAGRAASAAVDVLFVSGGGSPWEATLEEALLSLHAPAVSARTAVLVFSGDEGLGASRFSRDVWGLIEQAEEVLAAGKSLGSPAAGGAFEPANVLAECLKRYSQTILLSSGFAEHSEGDDLIDRLAAAPHVNARLGVCATHAALWSLLALAHGESYSAHAEPLGWRA